MTYALINDGQVVDYPYSIPQFRLDNPDISLPTEPTEPQLNEQDIYTVYPTPQPKYNTMTQNLSEGAPESTDGKWYQTWKVTPATPQEISERESNAKLENANYGKELLTETDWTQMPDVDLVNKADFTAYRSAIRSIAINPPVLVEEWPVKPEEVWSV